MPGAEFDYAAFEAVAAEVLDAWALDVERIELVSHAENVVFRVDAAGGDRFVLRFHRPGYHDFDELVSEQRWTRALLEADVDVPVPCATRDGAPYVRASVPPDHGERFVGLTRWVNGRSMRDLWGEDAGADVLAAGFHELGRIAAAIHQQSSGWSPPDGFRRPVLDLDGLVGEAPVWGPFWRSPELTESERAMASTMRTLAADRLRAYGTAPETFSLIHADLHPGNIIVNGDRLHVIDFDDAGFGWHQYEFAVALSHYVLHPEVDVLRDALIAGYRERRDFSDADLAMLPLFSLIRSLASIGWLADRPEIAPPGHARELFAQARDAANALFGADALDGSEP